MAGIIEWFDSTASTILNHKRNRMSHKFKEAADILEKRGKCIGVYIDDKGCVCAIGALALAHGCEIRAGSFDASYSMNEAWRELDRYVTMMSPKYSGTLSYSDSHTIEEVLNLLRSAPDE